MSSPARVTATVWLSPHASDATRGMAPAPCSPARVSRVGCTNRPPSSGFWFWFWFWFWFSPPPPKPKPSRPRASRPDVNTSPRVVTAPW
eukprot:31494-Pelagococcus_subviridis.AAC.31